MEVVLLENVKGLGKKLDVVNVNEGYARNYLFPKNLAKNADNKSKTEASSKRQALEYKKQTSINEAKEVKKLLETKTFEFRLKAKEGKFFGSITSKEISEQILTLTKIEVDKKKIELEENVKVPGIYYAKIKLYEGVIARVKIKVVEE